MSSNAGWFAISIVASLWSLLSGCSIRKQPEWRHSITAERVIDEGVASLSRPSSVIPFGDTAIIVFHSDGADPVIIDLRDGRVVGEFVATAELLDSALHDANSLSSVLETPDLAMELRQGRFMWYDQQRNTTYRPRYQHGVLRSDTSALFVALIPMPSIAWKGTERLEGIQQGMALIEIDLRTRTMLRCSLIEITDECAPQSFALTIRNGSLIMGSLNAQRVIDGHTDSIHVLARVSTVGRVEAERWYIPESVLRTHTWFMLTQMWSTWEGQMLGISTRGLALEFYSQEQLAYRNYSASNVPLSGANTFLHPALADDLVEVAIRTIDTSSSDTTWSLVLYRTPANATENDDILIMKKITASEIGPGCSAPSVAGQGRRAAYIRLVRRGEQWFVFQSVVTDTSS